MRRSAAFESTVQSFAISTPSRHLASEGQRKDGRHPATAPLSSPHYSTTVITYTYSCNHNTTNQNKPRDHCHSAHTPSLSRNNAARMQPAQWAHRATLLEAHAASSPRKARSKAPGVAAAADGGSGATPCSSICSTAWTANCSPRRHAAAADATRAAAPTTRSRLPCLAAPGVRSSGSGRCVGLRCTPAGARSGKGSCH